MANGVCAARVCVGVCVCVGSTRLDSRQLAACVNGRLWQLCYLSCQMFGSLTAFDGSRGRRRWGGKQKCRRYTQCSRQRLNGFAPADLLHCLPACLAAWLLPVCSCLRLCHGPCLCHFTSLAASASATASGSASPSVSAPASASASALRLSLAECK